MTLAEHVARLKEIRTAVADLRARPFAEGVAGAPVNPQTHGGDLILLYVSLTGMLNDVGALSPGESVESPPGPPARPRWRADRGEAGGGPQGAASAGTTLVPPRRARET